jgi:hypothetical protein
MTKECSGVTSWRNTLTPSLSVPLQVFHCEVDPNVMRLEKRIDLIAGLEAQQAAEIGFIKAT